MQKKGFEFSFAWLFAIIVGAIILFLAIFAISKLIKTSRYQLDTITAKQLSIIFEPLETGLASGKSNMARLREETRIYNDCIDEGNFGLQRISLSTKQSLGKEWQEPGAEIDIPNKYIFSSGIEEGEEVYFFSKPFEMPWKVSEIIFLSTKQYCFVNAPEEIEDDVLGLMLGNVKLNNCSVGDIKVCFGSGLDCDITVKGQCFGGFSDCESEYDYGFVEKQGESLFYTGSLIYAAIFSSPDIYECNVKRLMKRLVRQALIFKDEADFLSVKCGTLPLSGLLQLISVAKIKKSSDLLLVRQVAREVEEQNQASQCNLW